MISYFVKSVILQKIVNIDTVLSIRSDRLVTDCHQFAGFEPMIDFEVRDSIVISKHALPKISIIWIQARAEDCSFGMTIVLKPTALSRWGLLGAVLYRKMVYFSDTSSFSRALRLCNSLVLSQDRQIKSNHIRNKITCRFRFSGVFLISSPQV